MGRFWRWLLSSPNPFECERVQGGVGASCPILIAMWPGGMHACPPPGAGQGGLAKVRDPQGG